MSELDRSLIYQTRKFITGGKRAFRKDLDVLLRNVHARNHNTKAV